MESLFEAVGGDAGLRRLAEAWHRRMLADEVAAHPFQRDIHPQHTERLAAYWGEALGGPPVYSERFGGETRVVRIHSGNGEHDDMNRRAIACFDQALGDAGVPAHARGPLHDYFAWATTTTMYRYRDSAADVPPGLAVPHWSWNGRAG
ncbi:globin domain-containing protein [Actinoplanes sp. RD1]|uniref:globin domain-containing protein n=1 Tax=Actinoplanes sp. RD1 TaxID=3064538 RepID=UPI0027415AC7|nr:oxidoreductase [Actinoplanes sp. RD1]